MFGQYVVNLHINDFITGLFCKWYKTSEYGTELPNLQNYNFKFRAVFYPSHSRLVETWGINETVAWRLKQRARQNGFKSDLWRAEPCFEIRSLQVLRSSTLLLRALRADWTSEFCDPPPCVMRGDDEGKSSPESSVRKSNKRKGEKKKSD